MRSKLLAAAACGACLAALVCGPSALAQAGSPDQVPRFEPAMPVKALANARCGDLVVPEDRSRPGGRTVRLIVAILPALSARPKPDPVVYLAGGPGGIAIGEADLVVAAGLNRDRHLVIMNQRGTYLTEPALTCASIDDLNRELLGLRPVAAALANATIVSVPGVGHFVAPESACAQAVIASFLAAPGAPDASCVGTLTPPSFAQLAAP